jgi:hypothetical protein
MVFKPPLEESQIAVYWQRLKRFDIELLKLAAERLMDTSTFMPKPVDFIAIIEGSLDAKRALAWEDAQYLIGQLNDDVETAVPDPALARTIQEMGGIARLRRLDDMDEIKYRKAEFEAIYAKNSESLFALTLPPGPALITGSYDYAKHFLKRLYDRLWPPDALERHGEALASLGFKPPGTHWQELAWSPRGGTKPPTIKSGYVSLDKTNFRQELLTLVKEKEIL